MHMIILIQSSLVNDVHHHDMFTWSLQRSTTPDQLSVLCIG